MQSRDDHAGQSLPVKMWLYAMYKVSVARKGISSLQMAHELGITQKSAWHMLHRIKEACGGDQGPLSGIIEADETYIGGKARNKHHSKKPKRTVGTEGKQAVFGMRQRGGRPLPNPYLEPIEGPYRLKSPIPWNVGACCTQMTMEPTETSTRPLYSHEAVNHSANEYVKGMAHTNGIESVWAVLKRALVGTHHHVSVKHLHRYVNETTFRLNDGHVGNHLMDRIAALCQLSLGARLPYATLTKGADC